MENNLLKIQQSISKNNKSKIRRYKQLVVGSDRMADLAKYELITTLFSWIPGAVGLFLRSKFYPIIIGEIGRNVVFGTNIVLRHPGKIIIGNNVILDDNVMIDSKGSPDSKISISDEVFVGRNSILSCKGGQILLKERVNIGFNCEIFSSNRVEIGSDVLIAAYSYIVGGGGYRTDKLDVPINQQYDFPGKGGIKLEDDIWIGAHCIILDGVTIGKGSVVAAGAVVTQSIPSYSIAAGIPAKVIKRRE